MYLAIPSQPSCAQAWLAAAHRVIVEPDREAFNVVIDVTSPLVESDHDRAIIADVDHFLQNHDLPPTRSVANTIFPQSTYERHGSPDFYDVYITKVYPRKTQDWGRYFERLMNLYNPKTKESINPLRDLINRMREHVHEHERTFRNIYELAIYDPLRDATRPMNRQCLSFLSFKLTEDHRLMLTALYRNHYYMQRLLGNLRGLANLMAFVGKEAQVEVGSLTIISTHAEIDLIGSSAETASFLKNCPSGSTPIPEIASQLGSAVKA